MVPGFFYVVVFLFQPRWCPVNRQMYFLTKGPGLFPQKLLRYPVCTVEVILWVLSKFGGHKFGGQTITLYLRFNLASTNPGSPASIVR